MTNPIHPRSDFPVLSYRSGTGLYLCQTQKISRTIQKKTGWAASKVFDRLTAIGLPIACILDGVIVEPVRRLADRSYSRDVPYNKSLKGVFWALIGSVRGILFLDNKWELRDIDSDLIRSSQDKDWVLQCLSEGANPNAYGGIEEILELRAVDKSALGEACKNGHLEVVKELIKRNVDVNMKVFKRNTKDGIHRNVISPLALILLERKNNPAEQKKCAEIATCLIHAGAKVKNSSALTHALRNEFFEVVELLLKKKAKLPQGYTPLEVVIECNLTHLVAGYIKEPISLRVLKKALARDSWDAIFLYNSKASLKNVLGESFKDTVEGSLLCLYLSSRKDTEGLGAIGPFLEGAFPSEQELKEIQRGLIKKLEHALLVGVYPKNTSSCS